VNAETEPFARFVEAVEPWLREVTLIGGWAHRLYRLDPRARTLPYVPLTTLDGDVAVPAKLKAEQETVRDRLIKAGFKEEFVGEDRPPATHYHYGPSGGFYVEFLSALTGSEHDRQGKRKATQEVGGVSSQRLRYIDVLLIAPWEIELSEANGYPFKPAKKIRVANPASFLAQKILIHGERDHGDRAKDLLYMHDTIELFSDRLEELRGVYENEVRPRLHTNRAAELNTAPEALFAKVNDTIRDAARRAGGRSLGAEALAKTALAGLRELFRPHGSSS
jgi:hypothetical protein